MTNIIASFYSEEHIYFYKFGTKLFKTANLHIILI